MIIKIVEVIINIVEMINYIENIAHKIVEISP